MFFPPGPAALLVYPNNCTKTYVEGSQGGDFDWLRAGFLTTKAAKGAKGFWCVWRFSWCGLVKVGMDGVSSGSCRLLISKIEPGVQTLMESIG